ncbi:hypothetical protein CTAYLR_006512 [Chrysophaeum taylorii]|uniref:digalactosyldiacylglycerol synthase n=1 Tax=Chrysophaeum taylorii TaxID=2483200 RepID=A0AAD7ULE7_9STRA|nr:hypothetical protein CTAYLR_006512 [Chrysophaeum taylorii]
MLLLVLVPSLAFRDSRGLRAPRRRRPALVPSAERRTLLKAPQWKEEWRFRRNVWSSPQLAQEVSPEHVSAASDLSSLDRSIVIVTTASLPWMTGTAVNPALRAAYLAARGYKNVTLVLPWVADLDEQAKLFGPEKLFSSPETQADYVRRWCAENAEEAIARAPRPFAIEWYPARYAGGIGSILGIDDITSHIDPSEDDVVILEEPEHINWYRNGPRWTSRFRHVIGIAHTNYEAYTATERDGRTSLDTLVERLFTETVTRAHCDVVVQLSATLRPLPHSRVCNVHGVRETFLRIGDDKLQQQQQQQQHQQQQRKDKTTSSCYFLGKALWAKGYDQLLLLTSDSSSPDIHCFGDGSDLPEIKRKAEALGSRLSFMGRADHGNASVFGAYDVFVNPSISEVLCTATAEALAMGKSVVISRHPSNEFFYAFDKCHTFAPGDRVEFRKALDAAAADRASHDFSDRRASLDWEAATNRLVSAAALDVRAPPARLALASLVMHSYHWSMTASPLALDLWLTLSGAGPHTPWASRYPAAFKALNTTEAALKHASRTLEKASARLKRGDELARRLAKTSTSRTRRLATTLGQKNTVKHAAPNATDDEYFEDIRRRYYRRRGPARAVMNALGFRRGGVAPASRWLLASPLGDERVPKLPRELARRTARAASQLRKDLLERDMALRDVRRRRDPLPPDDDAAAPDDTPPS